MAKLWHTDHVQWQAERDKPEAEVQTRFNFVTYEDIVAESTSGIGNRKSLLKNSVAKALRLRYKLDGVQANQLLNDVLERHLREIYNTGLWG